jgi:anti-sigma factor RsiW
MMDHLDEGALQALLDGELPDPERAMLHLEGCPACGASYSRAVRDSAALTAALRRLDAAPPAPRPLPVRKASGWGWHASTVRRAAAILLTVAAAASATVPGSPLREWLTAAPGASPAPTAVEERSAAPVPAVAVEAAAEAGVMVEPANGRLTIGLVRPSPDLRVRAILTDGDRGGVFAIGAAADARFSTAAGRIEVADAAGGELRIQIPRRAIAASIEVDGRRYLEKQGDELRLTISPDAPGATEILFQVQP